MFVTIMKEVNWWGGTARWKEREQPVPRWPKPRPARRAQLRRRTLTPAIPYSNPVPSQIWSVISEYTTVSIFRYSQHSSDSSSSPRFFLQCGWWPFWEKQPSAPAVRPPHTNSRHLALSSSSELAASQVKLFHYYGPYSYARPPSGLFCGTRTKSTWIENSHFNL